MSSWSFIFSYFWNRLLEKASFTSALLLASRIDNRVQRGLGFGTELFVKNLGAERVNRLVSSLLLHVNLNLNLNSKCCE